MANLNNLRQVDLRAPGNMTFVSGLVAAGTNAGTVKTVTNTIVYLYDGQFKSYAPTDNIAVAAPTIAQLPDTYLQWAPFHIATTGGAVVGNTFNPGKAITFYLVLALDSAGTPTCFQGTFAGQDMGFRGLVLQKGDGLIPQIPDGFVPFAIIKIAHTASGQAYTHGTTAISTTGNRTVTFYNVSMLPSTTTL